MADRNLKIVWLYAKHYWERKMSSVRRHSLLAIMRHPEVQMVLSGPGWDNYEPQKSVQENVDRLLPGCDLIGWYKPLGEIHEWAKLEGIAPLRGIDEIRTPRCLRFNEAWWPDSLAMEEARQSGTRLVICHHEEDLSQFAPTANWTVSAHHIPHSAEKTVFAPVSRPDSERDIEVLLSGSLNPNLYPLRARVERLIREGMIPGVIRSHPPPFLGSLLEVEAQICDYAVQLGRTKIALMDGTKHLYPLSKYTEAAMAGALVIGTLPKLPPPGFSDFVVPLGLEATDEEIVDTVNYWLTHDEERVERALRGREIALSDYTQEHYAERFVRVVKEFFQSGEKNHKNQINRA